MQITAFLTAGGSALGCVLHRSLAGHVGTGDLGKPGNVFNSAKVSSGREKFCFLCVNAKN